MGADKGDAQAKKDEIRRALADSVAAAQRRAAERDSKEKGKKS